MKNTGRRLLFSILALTLCFAMLIGTTYAWFTDSVTSAGNKIVSGTLKMDLELLDKTSGQWRSIKESKEPLFTYDNWEPGYTDVTVLKIENEGSLALKWQARFVSANGVSKLAEAIDVYVKPSATEIGYPTTRDEISTENGWSLAGTLDKFIDTLSSTTYGNLLKDESAYLGIALIMQESAGNEYQELTLGEFDIQIVATQMSYESDDLGNDYDADAAWPEFNMNFETKKSLDGVATLYNELAEEVILRHEATGAYAVVPAGVTLKDGVTELSFSGKAITTDGNVSDDERNYDIHIEGIADNNTKCITVYIGKILPAGLSDTELKLYHEDALMTRVDSVADFAINNQFTYDSTTGEVVLYVDNFSVFTVKKNVVDVWDGRSDTTWYTDNPNAPKFTLTTAEQFAGFRDLVDGKNRDEGITFEGQIVELGASINLNNIQFDPIGFGYADNGGQAFMGIFDGAGNTIYNLAQNGWELGYSYGTQGGGLFASIKDATIKNLAINGANIVMECVDMGTVVGYAQGNCTFENIVVTNAKLANYQRYTGGVVGEVCKGENSEQEYTHMFKNVVVDSSVKLSSLWGDFDNACGGVIGGKWGTARVYMENVTVAAELDVFSDVTSAYRWYAYRRCGMLIGHTEQNSPKRAEQADAPFLTCDNVSVYYGDWVNYTYYEYKNQDSGTGRTYPWVRAEAGEHNEAFSNPRYGVPTHDSVKVTGLENSTDHTPIVFNQLYGGGQGVYGRADHHGVTVTSNSVKTFYIDGWEELRLQYWYSGGQYGDRWTTSGVEGMLIDNNKEGNVYKIELPAYVSGFVVTCMAEDGTKHSTNEILSSDIVENGTYRIEQDEESGTHIHIFINGACTCGETDNSMGEMPLS